MTTGQLIFFSGVGLLALTLILAIVFCIKKPQYIPENSACGGADVRGGQRTAVLKNGTAPLPRETSILTRTDGTVPLSDSTQPLTGGTGRLNTEGSADDAGDPYATIPLSGQKERNSDR